MDYAKSGDWELGMVIERREWAEATEIGDQISELGWDLTGSQNIAGFLSSEGTLCMSNEHLIS